MRGGFDFSDLLRGSNPRVERTTFAGQEPTQSELDSAVEMMRQGRSRGWHGGYNPPGALSFSGSNSEGVYSAELPPGFVLDGPTPPQATAPATTPQSPAAPPTPANRETPTEATASQARPSMSTLDINPGNVEMVADETLLRAEALRKELSLAFNNRAPRDVVLAIIAKHGYTPDQIENLEEVFAYQEQYGDASGPVPVGIKRPEGSVSVDERLAEVDPGALGAGVLGAADTITLGFSDELGAGIDAALGNGNYDDLLEQNRWVQRAADELHAPASIIGRVAGALVLPSAAPLKGASWVTNGLRTGAEGMAYGAAYGAGAANGSLEDRAVGALKGGAMGLAAGSVAGATVGHAAARVGANRANGGSTGAGVMSAARRLNTGVGGTDQIVPLPGHVGGGLTRTLHNLSEPAIVGGFLSGLAGKSNRYQENVGKALTRVAEDVAGSGVLGPRPVLGLAEAAARANDPAVVGSLAHFVDNFSSMTSAPYTKAAQLAGNAQLRTPKTIAAIDDLIGKWMKVPGGVKGMEELQELGDTLAAGTWTVDGLRRLRTEFGTKLQASSGQTREEANAMWRALSEDIFGGLRAAGNQEAANAYRNADRLYARSKKHLENIQKIIGKGQDSDHMIAERLATMGTRDAVRLSNAMEALPLEIRGEMQAAILQNLGRKKAGQATGDGEFSLHTFATNWNKLSEQARHAMAPSPHHRKDLDAIAALANADKRLHKTGDNPSGSARMLTNIGEAGALGSAVLGGPVSWGTLVSRWGLGILLAQPLVARAMVKVGNSGVTEASLKMLTRAARAAPMHAGAITGLRNDLAATILPETASPNPGDTLPEGFIADPLPEGFVLDDVAPAAPVAPAAQEVPGHPNLYRGPDGLIYDYATNTQVDISGL